MTTGYMKSGWKGMKTETMEDLIRILQEREEVSFEEAQYYLRKAGGNIEKAVFLIRKKRNSLSTRIMHKLKETFDAFWKYRIIICREDRMYLNVPFFVFALILLFVGFTGVDAFLVILLLVFVVTLSGVEMTLTKGSSDKPSVRVYRESPERTMDIRPEIRQDGKAKEPELKKEEKVEGEKNRSLDEFTEIIIK